MDEKTKLDKRFKWTAEFLPEGKRELKVELKP